MASHGYGKNVSLDKLLKDPSTREFFDIFRFLVGQLDPQLEIEGKIEDEVPAIMRRLKYPVEVNRSKLQAISGPNTWPQLLAVLDWLAVMVRINEEIVDPVAECQLAPIAGTQDEYDHVLHRSLQENYGNYLAGREDQHDEARLRQIYEQRIQAIEDEIQRMADQKAENEARIQSYLQDHERLLEMQKAPALLAMDEQRLQFAIQQANATVERLELEISNKEGEEQELLAELRRMQKECERLTEQVAGQAYSKRDIERLKCERNQGRQVLNQRKAEFEKASNDVWELNMQETDMAERIEEIARQTNEVVERLGQDVTDDSFNDFRVCVDLSEPMDVLGDMTFEDLRSRASQARSEFGAIAQKENAFFNEICEENRREQEKLDESERQSRRLKSRLESLHVTREDLRTKFANELEDASRAAEAAEDAVHDFTRNSAHPSLREEGEVDQLRMHLEKFRQLSSSEIAAFKEQIRKDQEKFEEHRRNVIKEFDAFAKMTEGVANDVELALEEEDVGVASRRTSRMARGGC